MTIRKIISLLIITALNTDVQSQTPYYIVDSLAGRAEIQRESEHKWRFVTSGEKLFNNDVIRTLSKDHLRLKWLDSTFVFINNNSQLQINLLLNKENVLKSHFTIISGEVFFKIPESHLEKCNNDFNVYSPTITASPKDASFLINARQDKSTEVKLLQGAFEIRTLKTSAKTYIGSPYKTLVTNTTDPIQKSALLQEDIDSLKRWIPATIIDDIMEEQLRKARRTFQILNGKLEDKCLITLFENNSGYNGSWNIGKIMPHFFAQRIQLANKGMRSEMTDTVVTDLLGLASFKKDRFFITGKIITFDIVQHAEITAQADEYRELRIARIKIHFTLTETLSNDKLLDKAFTGEITQKRGNENSWEVIQRLPFDLQDEDFSDCILGKAITQVLDQATEAMHPFF